MAAALKHPQVQDITPGLADAKEKVEDWRNYYNEERPHGAIGNQPPMMLRDGAASPPP